MRTSGEPLPPSQIALAVAQLPGWRHERNALTKEFGFPDFRSAIGWMMRASFEAEAINHHPEWTNLYRHVTVRLYTQSAGDRVTALDVELANKLERLATSAPIARA